MNLAPYIPPAPSQSSRSTSFQTPERTPSSAINLHLLRSCAMLAANQIARALESAESALQIAREHSIYHLVSKSHLYRGLCMMELSRWKDASNDFTRAANVRGWACRVAELKQTAEKKLLEERVQRSRRGSLQPEVSDIPRRSPITRSTEMKKSGKKKRKGEVPGREPVGSSHDISANRLGETSIPTKSSDPASSNLENTSNEKFIKVEVESGSEDVRGGEPEKSSGIPVPHTKFGSDNTRQQESGRVSPITATPKAPAQPSSSIDPLTTLKEPQIRRRSTRGRSDSPAGRGTDMKKPAPVQLPIGRGSNTRVRTPTTGTRPQSADGKTAGNISTEVRPAWESLQHSQMPSKSLSRLTPQAGRGTHIPKSPTNTGPTSVSGSNSNISLFSSETTGHRPSTSSGIPSGNISPTLSGLRPESSSRSPAGPSSITPTLVPSGSAMSTSTDLGTKTATADEKGKGKADEDSQKSTTKQVPTPTVDTGPCGGRFQGDDDGYGKKEAVFAVIQGPSGTPTQGSVPYPSNLAGQPLVASQEPRMPLSPPTAPLDDEAIQKMFGEGSRPPFDMEEVGIHSEHLQSSLNPAQVAFREYGKAHWNDEPVKLAHAALEEMRGQAIQIVVKQAYIPNEKEILERELDDANKLLKDMQAFDAGNDPDARVKAEEIARLNREISSWEQKLNNKMSEVAMTAEEVVQGENAELRRQMKRLEKLLRKVQDETRVLRLNHADELQISRETCEREKASFKDKIQQLERKFKTLTIDFTQIQPVMLASDYDTDFSEEGSNSRFERTTLASTRTDIEFLLLRTEEALMTMCLSRAAHGYIPSDCDIALDSSRRAIYLSESIKIKTDPFTNQQREKNIERENLLARSNFWAGVAHFYADLKEQAEVYLRDAQFVLGAGGEKGEISHEGEFFDAWVNGGVKWGCPKDREFYVWFGVEGMGAGRTRSAQSSALSSPKKFVKRKSEGGREGNSKRNIDLEALDRGERKNNGSKSTKGQYSTEGPSGTSIAEASQPPALSTKAKRKGKQRSGSSTGLIEPEDDSRTALAIKEMGKERADPSTAEPPPMPKLLLLPGDDDKKEVAPEEKKSTSDVFGNLWSRYMKK